MIIKVTHYIVLSMLTILMSFNAEHLAAQFVENDECIFATFIPDTKNYCSDTMEFSNIGATASPQTNPSCWPQNTVSSDVWYSFKPLNLSASIRLTGLSYSKEGTLRFPSMAVYSGGCNGLTEIGCASVLFNDNVIELTLTDLTIGQIYYIRIDGRENNEGTFKLCIDTYAPLRSPEADCVRGVVLCDKDPFFVERIEGVGLEDEEVNNTCVREEKASVWYRWTCKDAGTLTFTITPNNSADDIDFVVYEMSDIDGCGSKRPIRCMASGELIGADSTFNTPCFGPTGLSLTDNDVEETAGCQAGDNNFVKFIDMIEGRSYALVINNFSESGSGFGIEWGGTGTFLGPEADFEAIAREAFECDKTILFVDKSNPGPDSIVSWRWSFGAGADPLTSGIVDSIDVTYNSFGDKTVALTLESKRGCIVTKIVDFFINPCCRDTTNLSVSGIGTTLICPDIIDGRIDAMGMAGSPEYEFSLNGMEYQPGTRFFPLDSGNYTVFIRDAKGCTDTTIVRVGPAPDFTVDAGPDQEVDLGTTADILASVISQRDYMSMWGGPGFMDSLDQFGLGATVLPPGNTTYTITVTDENGCTQTDEVSIRVRIVRPVYYPNAIRPESLINGKFTLSGGPAVRDIEVLRVYDRWGNLMFEGKNLPINDTSFGWDGKFDGKDVNPGVYVWAADVRFIDDVVINYSGDVTVFR